MSVRILSCLLLVLTAFLGRSQYVCGQNQCVRVTSAADIYENVALHIGGVYPVDDAFGWMRRNLKKGKLCSTKAPMPALECTTDSTFSTFFLQKAQDGYVICRDTLFLAVKNTNDLEWVKSKSKATVWLVSELDEEGGFAFKNKSDEDYALVLNYVVWEESDPKNKEYFYGNYKNKNYPIYLYEILKEGTQEFSEDGKVLSLSGRWTAQGISNIDWQKAQVLDLSSAKLPEDLEDFRFRPKDVHTMVVVNASQMQKIPESWDWVLLKSEDGLSLFRQSVLSDEKAFANLLDFGCKEEQIVYRRHLVGDGAYETLCLPFSWRVPEDFLAYQPEELANDTLVLAPIEKVPAGQAVLVKPKSGDIEEIVVYSEACIIQSKEMASDILTGNMQILQTSDKDAVFFLNPEGLHFVPAPSGSKLKPFRAFLKAKE